MGKGDILLLSKELLEAGNTVELLKILNDEENRECVVCSGWELVGLLCKHMEYDSIEQNCLKCLQLLQKLCSPKEIILGLDLENCYSEKAFVIVLGVYGDEFIKLQKGQAMHLKCICANVTAQLEELFRSSKDNPFKSHQLKTNNLIGENQMSAILKKYECFCISLKEFVLKIADKLTLAKNKDLESYLIEPVKNNGWNDYDTQLCRNILCQFIFKVLEQFMECLPLLNRESVKNIKYCFSVFVESVLKMIRISEIFEFYASRKYDISNALCKAECNQEVLIFDNLGFTLFMYLIYVHEMSFKEIPLVYRIESILLTVMPHLNIMIKRSEKAPFEVGMELLFYLLNRISCKELEREHILYKHLLMGFYFVMIWGIDKSRREKAKEAFEELLDKFTAHPKFILISHVYESSHHAGMEALCISLMNALLMGEYPRFDLCKNISSLVLKYIEFIVGETHILLDSDRLLSGLNFLRFWFLKDPLHENKTGIWDKRDQIEKCLSILQHGIDVSRHEFKEILKNGPSKKDVEKLQAVSKMISGGTSLNSMDDNEKIKTINKAECLLDLMASIITRNHEIMNAKS